MNCRRAVRRIRRHSHRRRCVAAFLAGACAVALCPGIEWGLGGIGQMYAGEPAPMPPVRQDEPLRFEPQMREAFSDRGAQGEDIGNVEAFSAAPPMAGLDRGRAPDLQEMPGDFSSLGPSRFFRAPEERYLGPGQPLIQESWRFRPFSVSGIFGLVQGGPLIKDWVRANQGASAGVQLGWDGGHYWGFETRLAWAEVDIIDSDRAIAAQHAKDDAAGLAPNDPFRHRFDSRRHDHLFFWDAHTLVYPWGDAAWRPYLMAGLGTTQTSFMDRTDVRYRDILFTVPFGAGIKYRANDFFAVRMECADYIAFGGGQSLELTHNVMITGGVELRFGGPRRAYWPWNPGRHYW